MNGAMIPEALPMVNCRPFAVALLPYLGLLFGNQAKGRPTRIYRPAAMRKHLSLSQILSDHRFFSDHIPEIVNSFGCRGYQNCISHQANSSKDDTENSALLGSIREVRNGHIHRSADEVTRDRQ